jgi:chitodextrinase
MAAKTDSAVFEFLSERARKGGKARLVKMTAAERSRIAKLAAEARWHKKADAPDPTDPQGPQRDRQGAEGGIM